MGVKQREQQGTASIYAQRGSCGTQGSSHGQQQAFLHQPRNLLWLASGLPCLQRLQRLLSPACSLFSPAEPRPPVVQPRPAHSTRCRCILASAAALFSAGEPTVSAFARCHSLARRRQPASPRRCGCWCSHTHHLHQYRGVVPRGRKAWSWRREARGLRLSTA
jgi:hypothetical protein